MTLRDEKTRPVWFVGASWGGTHDQTDRFIRIGIWENGYRDGEFYDLVKAVQPGDRIAIKARLRRRRNLPFDNRDEYVAGMFIKAIGVVTRNAGDGRFLSVDWTRIAPPKEWYFSMYAQTIHAVYPDDWKTYALIAFAFDNKPQDIERWRNDPQYRDRFGDRVSSIQPNPSGMEPVSSPEPLVWPPYTTDDILADGCFLEQSKLETTLKLLKTKRNIILQGPPGAGKTWLSKRLAYALIGSKDDGKVRQVQFHPNLSYEDFVRGYRPDGDSKLTLMDGPFLKLCEVAGNDPANKYVMVIEEINRGNPASIFGELLTLLEADKRSRDDALALAYPRSDSERFHIPPNVYVIGTMNLADRSLALVDFALRRRFAFFDLEPMLNSTWRDWVQGRNGIQGSFLDNIAQRVSDLNDQITSDPNLGPQFRIGHSHLTPPPDATIEDPAEWFTNVVDAEIAPLLREYWFDDAARAEEEVRRLVIGQ